MYTVAVLAVTLAVAFGFQAVDPPRQDCLTRPGPYGPCSASCGGGQKTRQLQIIQDRIGYGKACPPLSETVSCNEQPCPVDCQVEQGQWSACSATCGQGTQTKLDQILVEASNGGRQCPSSFHLRQTRPCQFLPACPVPVDCVIGYTEYSQCTRPCGGGTQTRTAFIVSPAANGGAPCPADLNALTSTRPCNEDIPCAEPKNCEMMTGDYGSCSVSCGTGIQTRHSWIVAQPENGGQACPPESSLVETRPCSAGPCPVPEDCLVQFPPFSQCSKQCGGGYQSTTGQIIRQASAGGAPCPTYAQLTIQRTCNNAPCAQLTPVNCQIEYGAYSQCSAPCGGGYQARKGYVKVEAQYGGLACPAESSLIERLPCNQHACEQPEDCVVQQAYWSKCKATVPCASGIQTRQLTIVKPAKGSGLPCPSNLVQTRKCELPASERLQCQKIPTPPVVTGYGRRPAPVGPITRPVQPAPVPRPAFRPALIQTQPKQVFSFAGGYRQ